MLCKECGKSTTNPVFCSKSCSAKFNNKQSPKRISKHKDSIIKLRKDGLTLSEIKNELGCSLGIVRYFTKDVKVNTKEIATRKLKANRKDIGSLISTSTIRSRMIKDGRNVCDICGISTWNGVKITLEIHHVDGNNKNNTQNNLQMLCPNCHSQTDNYRNRNRNN